MATWKNLDTLETFKALSEVKRVKLAEAMSGAEGAERVRSTVYRWQRDFLIILLQSRWMMRCLAR